MMIKVYNVRITSDGHDEQFTALPLDNVVTALLRLEAGDAAVIDCTHEQAEEYI